MRAFVVAAVFSSFVFISTGCGSDGSAGGSSTLSPTSAASYCEAACDQELVCDPQNNQADCISGCMEDGATLRGSLFVDMYSCRANLPCGTNDDVCDPVTPELLPIHEVYQAECVTTLTECQEQQDLIDNLCGTDPGEDMAEELPLLASDVTQQLLDCLALDCADVPDCIDRVVDL